MKTARHETEAVELIYRLREVRAVQNPADLLRSVAERALNALPAAPTEEEIRRAVWEAIGPEPDPAPDAAGIPTSAAWWRWQYLFSRAALIRIMVRALLLSRKEAP